MTLDEFLDSYVPNVLKPLGGWKVSPSIRRGQSCPLTAVARRKAKFAGEEAARLGLSGHDRATIAYAADFEARHCLARGDRDVRARLLAGLGLQEG